MFIPGQIISVLTFPGVIVHEFAHLLFCKIRRVPVLDVCYFQFENPAGYVIHERTDDFADTFFIAMGPFFVNTLLCLLICFPAFMPISYFDVDHPFSYFLLWLGVSIGMHAIPSTGDADNIWEQGRQAAKKFDPLAILSLPLVLVIYIVNALRVIWADLGYGILIGVGLPSWYYGV